MNNPHTIDHKIVVADVTVSYDETIKTPRELELDPWPISVRGTTTEFLFSAEEALQVSNHLRALALPLLKDKP